MWCSLIYELHLFVLRFIDLCVAHCGMLAISVSSILLPFSLSPLSRVLPVFLAPFLASSRSPLLPFSLSPLLAPFLLASLSHFLPFLAFSISFLLPFSLSSSLSPLSRFLPFFLVPFLAISRSPFLLLDFSFSSLHPFLPSSFLAFSRTS